MKYREDMMETKSVERIKRVEGEEVIEQVKMIKRVKVEDGSNEG